MIRGRMLTWLGAILWPALACGLEWGQHTPVARSVRAADYDPTGRWVAAVHADSVRVYDVPTGRRLGALPAPSWRADIDLLDDRHLASGHADGAVRVWDARAGVQLWSATPSSARITAVALVDIEDAVAWGDADGAVGVLRRDGDGVRVIAHEGIVTALRYAPGTGQLVSTGADGAARVWRLPELALRDEVRRDVEAHEAQLDPTGRLLAVTWRDAWGVTRLPADELFLQGDPYDFETHVALGRDGRYAAHVGSGWVQVRRVEDGRPIVSLPASGVAALHVDEGLSVAAVGVERLHRWDLGYHAPADTLPGAVRDVAFCGPEEDLVAAGGAVVRVWPRARIEAPPWEIDLHAPVADLYCGAGTGIAVSLGRTATASARVGVLDLAARDWQPWADTDATMSAVALSPDGTLLATGPQIRGAVRLWNNDGTQRAQVPVDGPVRQLRFDPAGRALAALEGGWLRVWRVPGLETALAVETRQRADEITFAAYEVLSQHGLLREVEPGLWVAAVRGPVDAAGGLLAWPGRDGIALRELAAPRDLADLHVGAQVTGAALSADGRTVAAGDPRGRVHLWTLREPPSPPTAVAQVREVPAAAEPGAASPALTVFPNPVNAHAVIAWTQPEAGAVSVTIHDVLGRRVRSLQGGRRSAGVQRVRWDGSDDAGRPAASGIYLVRVTTTAGAATGRVVLLR